MSDNLVKGENRPQSRRKSRPRPYTDSDIPFLIFHFVKFHFLIFHFQKATEYPLEKGYRIPHRIGSKIDTAIPFSIFHFVRHRFWYSILQKRTKKAQTGTPAFWPLFPSKYTSIPIPHSIPHYPTVIPHLFILSHRGEILSTKGVVHIFFLSFIMKSRGIKEIG